MKNNLVEKNNTLISPALEIGLFVIVLIIAAFLRFYQLRANPGWYSDEGSFINVADNLSHGKWQYFAIKGSPLLIGRPPLFFVLLAGVFNLFGVDILALRILTGLFSLASIVLLYWTVREMFDPGLALLSACLLGIYPWAVTYSRIGFTYNQLSLLMVLVVLACWKVSHERNARWGLIAGMAAGLAVSTDYLGIVAVALVLITYLGYDRRHLVIFTLWTLLTSIIILVPIWFTDPSGFIGDLGFTFQRVSVSPAMQIINLIIYYNELLRREVWLVIGFIGIFLLPNQRAKGMILFIFCATILLTVRSLPPVGRNYHHLIQLFPFIALGLARFLSLSYNKMSKMAGDYLDKASLRILRLDLLSRLPEAYFIVRKLAVVGVVFLFVVSPFVWMFVSDFSAVVYGVNMLFTPENEHNLSTESEMDRVVGFLASEVTEEDLVIASPQLVWAVPSRKADFAQALVAQEKTAEVLPSLSSNRFEYNSTFDAASFVVIDPLAAGLAVDIMPSLEEVIHEVRTWPVVYSEGEIQVHRNPNK